MSQYIEGQRKSFKSASTAGANLRWAITDASTNPATVSLAGASAMAHCVNEDPVLVSGDEFSGRLTNAQGTRKMVASEAITGGNPVYAAASGKIASTGTIIEGIALESAGANNDIIEVIPIHNSDIGTAISGTTAATFEADSDLGKPRTALGSQTGGTGDFKAVIKPPTTLTADRVFTLVGNAATNLVGDDTAQTLTNKTLTSPVVTQPGSNFPVYIPHGAHAAAVAPAGAVPITNFYSTLDSNAGATTATLADGAVNGQLKKIQMIVDGGDVVLTPANLAGGTTITFADAGDYCVLVFNGTDWVAIELGNDADGATAPVLA